MTSFQRQGRSLFLTFLCSAWVMILMAAPLVSALEPAAVGGSRAPLEPQFERLDRNYDGFVSPREAARVRGLAAGLTRADLNGDGLLDKVEFARALARLER
jgi:hypothetical protein